MTDRVAVVIATFGDRAKWDNYAKRALASVSCQTRLPDFLIRYHGESLHQARNHGAELAAGADWLCFLDADDELEEGYLGAMMSGQGDLRYPRVRYVSEHLIARAAFPQPIVLPKRPLLRGNYMVIGTLIRRAQFLRVGGFDDYPAYEDWALWTKCWIDGAQSQLIGDAVYRAYTRRNGRNRVADPSRLFAEIVNRFKPLAEAKGLL